MIIGKHSLDDFIGFPSSYLDEHLALYGFDSIPCFNDYKCVWVSHELNLTIQAHVYHSEEEIGGCYEIIDEVYYYNGINK